MVKKTAGQKLWDVTRKKMKKQAQESQNRLDYEVINGFTYDYPCTKQGHTHTIDCLTPEMLDAMSEEVYAQDA